MRERSLRIKCLLAEFGSRSHGYGSQRASGRKRASAGNEISGKEEFENLATAIGERPRPAGPSAQKEKRRRALGVFLDKLGSCSEALNVCGLIDQERVLVIVKSCKLRETSGNNSSEIRRPRPNRVHPHDSLAP